MTFKIPGPTKWTWFSPWVIIGSVCLLAGILTFLAMEDVNREKEFMERALLSQANVLMRSVEAGTRAGMMGMGRGYRNQMLLEETAKQSDVLFLALVTESGQVVAHSNPQKVGETIEIPPHKPGETSHCFFESDGRSFEVMRAFQPWHPQRGRGSSEMWCDSGGPNEQRGELFILAALDPTPFEEASRQDMQHTIILFGTMLLVGAAGFISLVWGQGYRQARRSLQDMSAFTATVLNQMPVGFLMIDPDGRIAKTNVTACRILQCSEGGSRIDDFPCFLGMFSGLKREEETLGREVLCRLSDSLTVPLLVNAALIRDSGNQPTGYVFLFSDMTKIKLLEEQLRRSERLAGLGRLAAGVAHEIRNPLSSIKGFATILARRCGEDDPSRKLADVMAQEVERLNRAVTDLLDFARPTDLNRRSVSCHDLIQNALRLLEKDALEQGVAIVQSIQPRDLEIEVDPDRFVQVLLNLCLNAIHSMEDGGTLRVGASIDRGSPVVFVADSGAGIQPEHLPHIFDPYFTTKPKGVGLGLANVHKFVEAHGGEIEVSSAPGKGTKFLIRLYSNIEGPTPDLNLKSLETTKNEKTAEAVDFNSR